MEIFVDFGLFEVLGYAGLVALARILYSVRWLAWSWIVVSVVAPGALIFLVRGEPARWLAPLGFTTALVNASVLVRIMRHQNLSTLIGETTKPTPEGSSGESSRTI